MSLQKKFEDKIKKKEQDIYEIETQITELQVKINESRVYIQALQDAIKLLPKVNGGTHEAPESKIRPGSAIGKTLVLLKQKGKPMHIDEILIAIGKTTTKKDKAALAGSLGWYVRRLEIFIRTAPNTFGLKGRDNETGEPPDDFGTDQKTEDKTTELEPF